MIFKGTGQIMGILHMVAAAHQMELIFSYTIYLLFCKLVIIRLKSLFI